MDFSEHVLSAGKAVLDMVEREWQPLSESELEHRLDQVVEEILESDLVAKLVTQPPHTFYVQVSQSQVNKGPQSLQTSITKTNSPDEKTMSQEPLDNVDNAAVKYISDLLQNSKSRTRMAGRARLSVSHTVLLSLTLLSERVSYRSVSRRFKLEKGNIHRIFFSFCESINMLEEKHIRWPVGKEAEEALFPISNLLGKEVQAVPQVLGVLGHTQIPIRLLVGKNDSAVPEVKRMKREAKPDSWLNLELVCNRSGHFLHCRISKGSDLERGKALRDRLKLQPELMPTDSCLIARANYPLTAQVLTPYTISYGPKDELFNKTLEQHFQIFDQAVAKLKARFQRLKYLDIGNYDRARAVVLTACVLHNVFLNMGQVVQGEIEKEEALSQKGEEEDEEGVRRRDTIADLLFRNVDSEST
ncbi:protein ALP1-like [Melanotaenia boesemani]|uniref:protein ALP1-like n=1 Tax=Melanotaenia boesemani TaxID=1250792 RepID=UPI001C05E6BC|nr:protein ALP1-like [Melanotaenia boesemani]